MYTALKPLKHEIVTMAKIIGFDFFPFDLQVSFYGRAPLLKQIKKKLLSRSQKIMTSFLVMRFWCFKNFQMPPPKKYDNKILHVGPVEVFWHFRQNLPNFTRFFTQILGKKVSLSDVIKISYVVSTCRTWWSFLTLSAKFTQFYTFFYPNFGEKSVPKWCYQN